VEADVVEQPGQIAGLNLEEPYREPDGKDVAAGRQPVEEPASGDCGATWLGSAA
jgi:hypothetical protein